jgi:hypothetical protein
MRDGGGSSQEHNNSLVYKYTNFSLKPYQTPLLLILDQNNLCFLDLF